MAEVPGARHPARWREYPFLPPGALWARFRTLFARGEPYWSNFAHLRPIP